MSQLCCAAWFFTAKVIKPAINDIVKNTNLKLSFEEEKTGRKVTKIIFKIKKEKISNNTLKSLEDWVFNGEEDIIDTEII